MSTTTTTTTTNIDPSQLAIRRDSCRSFDLSSSLSISNDSLGKLVALDRSGNTALAYAGDIQDKNGSNSGKRGTYELNGIRFDQNDADMWECEAAAVAPEWVALGCPHSNNNNGHVLLMDGSTGVLIQKLTSPTPAVGSNGKRFGGAVVMSAYGNYLVISAPQEPGSNGDPSVGVVYLYEVQRSMNDGTVSFKPVRTFTNPSNTQYDYFGISMAMNADGSKLLIGAIGVGGPTYYPQYTQQQGSHFKDAGAAFLYDTSSGNLLQTFINPDPLVAAGFAQSIAMNDAGTLVVIGAPNNFDLDVSHTGRVYFFDAMKGSLLRTMNSPRPGSGDNFGRYLAMNGDGTRLLVGAPYQDVTVQVPYGLYYATQVVHRAGMVFLMDGTTGAALELLEPGEIVQDGHYGVSVAINRAGTKALIGAPNGGSRVKTGVAYQVCLDQAPVVVPTHQIVPQDLRDAPRGGRLSMGGKITLMVAIMLIMVAIIQRVIRARRRRNKHRLGKSASIFWSSGSGNASMPNGSHSDDNIVFSSHSDVQMHPILRSLNGSDSNSRSLQFQDEPDVSPIMPFASNKLI